MLRSNKNLFYSHFIFSQRLANDAALRICVIVIIYRVSANLLHALISDEKARVTLYDN